MESSRTFKGIMSARQMLIGGILTLPSCLAIAQGSVDEIIGLHTERRCQVNIEEATDRYENLQDVWLTKKTSDYNIERNFTDLSKLHKNYFDEVADFADSYSVIPTDPDVIITRMREIDGKVETLVTKGRELSKQDNKLQYSIQMLRFAIEGATIPLSVAKDLCESGYPEVQVLMDGLGKWDVSLEKLGEYLSQAEQKRINAIYLTKRFVWERYRQEYSKFARGELEKSLLLVGGALVADEIDTKLRNWSHRVAVRGVGGPLFNDFYFEEPLVEMLANRERGHELLEEMERVPGDNSVKASALRRYRSTLEDIDALIAEHVRGGWKGRLELQLETNQDFFVSDYGYSSACQQQATAFIEFTRSVDSHESFRESAERFRALSAFCESKEGDN